MGVIVSLFLAWRDPGVHLSDIPAAFLWDRAATAELATGFYFAAIGGILALVSAFMGSAHRRRAVP